MAGIMLSLSLSLSLLSKSSDISDRYAPVRGFAAAGAFVLDASGESRRGGV